MDHGPVPLRLFTLEEDDFIDFIPDTSLKIRFSRKSYIEFLVYFGGVFLHLSRKAYLQWQPSKQYRSMTNLENYIEAVISKLETPYDEVCWKRQPHPSQ
jgi:hypothetical protein